MGRSVLHTRLCDLLGIEYPILLAGMGSRGAATPPPLVAAVSNAGGLGVLGGASLSPEQIRDRIREIRSLTAKPFGVDLLLPASLAEVQETRSSVRQRLQREFPKHVAFVRDLMRQFDLPDTYIEEETFWTRLLSPKEIREQVEVVLAERAPVFAAGLGDPAWVVPLAREQGMKVIGLAGSVRNAMRQLEAGVDIIVAQGTEAGGHTGKIANFPLIPQVVDAAKPVPVVAAGGIADGRGVAASMALGAVGAWIGTAFLLAEECVIPEALKEQIISGSSEQFVSSRAYTGKTARNYNNVIIEAWEGTDLEPLPMPLQGVLLQDFVEAARKSGRYDLTNNPAGQIGGMLKERKPAARIMAELVEGAVEVLQGLQHTIQQVEVETKL